jgi:hypothetical protein
MFIDQGSQNRIIRHVVAAGGVSLLAIGLAGLSSACFEDQWLSLFASLKGQAPPPHWLDGLQALGLSALLSGMIVVLVGWLVPQRRALIGSPEYRDWVLVATSTAAIVALWLPVVLVGQSAIFAGERYWWLRDDAMISMRYGRNMANGFGLVWNLSGERVEGYTNFLWTIYMALVHLLPVPAAKTSLLILLTNLLLAIAVIPVIVRLIRALGGGTLVTAATLLAYVLNRNVMSWTTQGFETALLTLLFMLSVYRIIREADLGTPRLLTPVLVATMSLVRADAIFLSALLYALALILNPNRKLVLAYSAPTLILPIAHELFRLSYYGDVLPNTAYLKAFGWTGRYTAGWRHVIDFATEYRFALALALAGLPFARKRNRVYLLVLVLIYTAYLGYVGGDPFPDFRFFVPILPLVLVLAFLGAEALGLAAVSLYLRSVSSKGATQSLTQEAVRPVLLTVGAITVVLSLVTVFTSQEAHIAFVVKQLVGMVVGVTLLICGFAAMRLQGAGLLSSALTILCLVTLPLLIPTYRGSLVPRRADAENVRLGLLLKQNTPDDSKVADFWAGSVFYFSERPAIDLLGKSDRYIAHLPARPGGMVAGHNKFDFDYSIGELKPDFVVANFDVPIDEEFLVQHAAGDFAFTGQLYFNGTFRDHCLLNPVAVNTWRTIFVCDWSSQVDSKDGWTEPDPQSQG